MEILARVLHDAARVPTKAHHDDAGFDLVAVETVSLAARGGRGVVATGLAFAIPEGCAGLVLPRSGLAMKHGVTCVNAPGLLDPGYRGEVKVALVNLDPEHDYVIHTGDRVAQLVIVALAPVSFRESAELPPSTRGDGGFGSSGR